MVPVHWYTYLAIAVFAIGVYGFLTRRSIIFMFLSIELMLNGVNIAFISFSHYMQDATGQVFSFFVICVAAAEAAIGLAIIISVFRNKETVYVDEISESKG